MAVIAASAGTLVALLKGAYELGKYLVRLYRQHKEIPKTIRKLSKDLQSLRVKVYLLERAKEQLKAADLPLEAMQLKGCEVKERRKTLDP
ncbi:hypothetical protein BDW74DRAFT_183023 [Aspergillus multicolor]|uniref:uncharacterized protein n=1 Tax=Aspergillus multicolor TaxID=41759 RepID=UPI003CCE2C5E